MKSREEADEERAAVYVWDGPWRLDESARDEAAKELSEFLAEVRRDERERLAALFDMADMAGVTPVESNAVARALREGEFKT